jgi:hypothetical protein
MSMSLRGWITETDQLTSLGPDGRPAKIAVRGYTDEGDATEDFSVDANGIARWKTAVDEGSAPFGNERYSTYGGPRLASDLDVEALVGLATSAWTCRPAGGRHLIGAATEIDGPAGKETVKLAYITGAGLAAASLARQGPPLFRLCRRDFALAGWL